jgi:TatA/E family protein of Tat protein translocase
MNLGPAEILVILVVALLVFGPKRLPEVGRQVGGAMRELRRFQDGIRSEVEKVMAPDDERPPVLPPGTPPVLATEPGAADVTETLRSAPGGSDATGSGIAEEPDHTELPEYLRADPDDDRSFDGPPGSFL